MRRELKKSITRARLVEAALECFGESGYEKVTVEEITRRSNVAKGTFFNYFQSKADILLQVGAVQEEWMVQQIASLAESDNIVDAIIELMVTTATRLPLSRPLVRAMFQATLQRPEESAVQVSHFRRVGQALIPVCELAQSRGELTNDVSAYRIAGMIMQTYSGALLTWALTSEPGSLGELVRFTFDCVFNGLRAKAR